MTRSFGASSSPSVVRVNEATLAERGGVAHIFDGRTPAILEGIASGWSFMRKWSKDYLVSTMGDYRVTVARDSRPALSKEKYDLRTYFREYAHLSTITFESIESRDDPLPAFLDDIPLPNACFDRNALSAAFLYHANDSMGGLPHCHMDAFNLLQRGRKRWVMYDADPELAPRGAELLARCHVEYGAGHHVREWFADGLDSLRNEGIDIYECIQEPGDVVYIPEHFAHAVLNLEESMGIVVIVKRPGRSYLPKPGGGYSPHGAQVYPEVPTREVSDD